MPRLREFLKPDYRDRLYALGHREPLIVSVVTSGLWEAGLDCMFKYKAWHVSLGR